ncbi:myb domain-containing protein [Tieghemostelium lacteum]|uniref:Myb domain-containing protein n=1 Tax=Tieghemostelium lacteum TaxID=361077 RepID=A0A151Z5D4_TIELA|nr:myb domain-containing protein [Tieghemostelium lacteum]|eukprot:KYQ89148.1 myb domain-containing protein [Tieghemostelium lacteum]
MTTSFREEELEIKKLLSQGGGTRVRRTAALATASMPIGTTKRKSKPKSDSEDDSDSKHITKKTKNSQSSSQRRTTVTSRKPKVPPPKNNKKRGSVASSDNDGNPSKDEEEEDEEEEEEEVESSEEESSEEKVKKVVKKKSSQSNIKKPTKPVSKKKAANGKNLKGKKVSTRKLDSSESDSDDDKPVKWNDKVNLAEAFDLHRVSEKSKKYTDPNEHVQRKLHEKKVQNELNTEKEIIRAFKENIEESPSKPSPISSDNDLTPYKAPKVNRLNPNYSASSTGTTATTGTTTTRASSQKNIQPSQELEDEEEEVVNDNVVDNQEDEVNKSTSNTSEVPFTMKSNKKLFEDPDQGKKKNLNEIDEQLDFDAKYLSNRPKSQPIEPLVESTITPPTEPPKDSTSTENVDKEITDNNNTNVNIKPLQNLDESHNKTVVQEDSHEQSFDSSIPNTQQINKHYEEYKDAIGSQAMDFELFKNTLKNK